MAPPCFSNTSPARSSTPPTPRPPPSNRSASAANARPSGSCASAATRSSARNWSCHAGEFDLITRDGPWLVFTEVKATEHGDLDRPEERVTPAKIKKLRQAASVYLIRFRGNMPAVRFDVVAVEFPGGDAKPVIRHVEHAFDVERSTATR